MIRCLLRSASFAVAALLLALSIGFGLFLVAAFAAYL